MDEKTLKEQQEASEIEEPPGKRPLPARSWRVAVIANVKGETALPFDAPADAGAEFDRKETVEAIMAAIKSAGHNSFFLSADESLTETLKLFRPDICFNIAEGICGDAREAQVPALLEMLRIPYTASRVLANAIALDKTVTKRIWQSYNLPTAAFQEFVTGSEPISSDLRYPLFVKPSCEGTGMGLDENATVYNKEELRARVQWVIENYQQSALVEEYLPGREFTVGVLGREDAAQYSRHPELYASDGFHALPVLELDTNFMKTPGFYGYQAKQDGLAFSGPPAFVTPAHISNQLRDELQSLAIQAHKAIGALDVSRIDFRLDSHGIPRLMEINTLPGVTPVVSDLVMEANAEGLSYNELILEILYLGASRYGLLKPVQEHQMMNFSSKVYAD